MSSPVVPETPKKGSAVKITLGIVLVSVLASMCSNNNSPVARTTRTTQSATVTVSLEIMGFGDLTYSNASGNTEQLNDKQSPSGRWATVESFRAERGEFLYVSIQNNRETGGVECRIKVEGVVVESAKSDGAYVIATCSGSA